MSSNPMFQHRHYVAIAQIIAQLQSHTDESHKIDLDAFTRETAEFFASDNSNFNLARYRAAAAGSPINGRDKVR